MQNFSNFVTEATQYCVHGGLQQIKGSLAKFSNFDEILFTQRIYLIGVFLQPRKSHALNGRSDSTLRLLTLPLSLGHLKITIFLGNRDIQCIC